MKSRILYSVLVLFVPLSLAADDDFEVNQTSGPVLHVTANPFSPTLSEYGRPVSVVSKSELTIKTDTTLGQTIGQEPGVSSSYFGPGASRPVIRGNAGDRVRVLKNGIGTLDVSNTSEDHQVSANPLAAESIEILRGPETLLFGSSAIGGVVNVTDNAIPEQEIGKHLTGAFDYRQGTADDELTGALKLEGQQGHFNWHFDGFHQDTSDIDISGKAESSRLRELEAESGEGHEEEIVSGKLPSSATRSKGVTAGGSYIWDKGFIGTAVNYNFSRYGIPGHAHEEEHEEEVEQADNHLGEGVLIKLEQLRVDLRGAVEDVGGALKKIKFNVGVSNYDHAEIEDGEVGTRFENDAVESRVEFHHANLGDLEGMLGVQLEASDFSVQGEEAFLPDSERYAPALFAFEELLLSENLKLQIGGRVEHVLLDPEGHSSNSFTPFSLSSGLVIDPTGNEDYTLGLSAAITQRAPSVAELYADGLHVARQIFELGNSELELEQSLGVNLNIRKNTGFATGGLNLFVQHYQDYINLAGLGEEEEGFPVFVYDNVRAQLWGAEAEATFHLHQLFGLMTHDLDFGLQTDWVRGRNESGGKDLARIPPLRTIVSLEYGWKNSFHSRIEGVFVATQNKTADFELPTDAYQMLNVHAEYKLASLHGVGLSLYVRGSNLTDREARVHSSFIKDLAPLMGRSFLFGLRGTF